MQIKEMPVLFLGHGSPLNAIENNEFSNNWKILAGKLPKPKLILCISAHWLREGSAVTAMENPKTIHDFYGFPEKLYKVSYPAKGSKEYAKLIKELVKTVKVSLDNEWGLDHGTWSLLVNMYPKSDIPVLQLSLDYQIPLDKVFEIGKELKPLRKQGVLIIASGNLVHNLMLMNPSDYAEHFDWAVEFDNIVKENLNKKDHHSLINYTKYKSSNLAHPTNDHYIPLIYVIGAAENESIQFFNEKIIMGSISMRCVIFGMEKIKFI